MISPRARRSLVVAAASLLLLTACTGSPEAESDEDAEHTGREGDGWTVLHYSMGDTNLEPFMVEDVNELGEVGSNDNLRIREFMDRSAEYGEDPLLDQGDWVGGRVLDIADGGTTELVEDLGDVNSADPDVLAEFIAEGIEANRAGHYALIISDHGSSWPGIGPDEGSDFDVLDLAEITEAVSSGLEQAGVDKLDLLGFDACLMANYEVASALAPLADRMVASQELEPGHGWDYRSLQLLADEPDTTVDELGSEILAGFASQAEEQGTQDEITLALIDLTKMPTLDEAFASFADVLTEEAETVAPVVGQTEASTLAFGKSPDETQDKHLSDLGLLVGAIGESAPEVADQADELVAALDDAVVDRVEGVGTAGATGLSIYLPPVPGLADPAYTEVESGDPWEGFLDTYYEEGEEIAAAEMPTFLEAEPALTFDDDGGITLDGTFDAATFDNVTQATISYALANPDGSVTYLGEEIADFSEDGGVGRVSGSYDFSVLELFDQEDTALAYVELGLSDDLSTAFFDVPMTYYASTDRRQRDPKDALLSLVLDIEAGEFVSETLYTYDEVSGGYGELAPDPEGILVPDVLTVTPAGDQIWEPTTDVGLYADIANLTYEFVPLDSGSTIQADLTVYDFGGNASTISSLVEVP